MKEKLFEILMKPFSEYTKEEWIFIQENLTYELANEFIDTTGLPVILPGITEEEIVEYHFPYLFSLN